MLIKSPYKLVMYLLPIIILCFLFSLCSWTRSKITIKRFVPEGEVSRKTNFTITFSETIVPPESVDIWIEPDFLKIVPPLEGKCKWISQKELRFFPEEQLRPSAKYLLEVSDKIVKLKDKRFSGKRSFEFHSARIKSKGYTHEYRINEKKPGLVNLYISLEFNHEISPLDLQEKLRIRFKKGEDINFKIEQKNPSFVLTAVSASLPLKDIDRKIQLHIDKDLKPKDGTLTLFDDYDATFSMPARKRLVVERAYPGCSGEIGWITVEFSAPVAIEAIEDFIKIEPEVSHHLQRSHRNIHIHGKFSPGETYVLTLRKGFLALNGCELENEFSAQIEMRELEPYFDFITKGIFLSKRGNLNIGIETININKLELSVEKVFVNNLVYFLNTNRMYSRYFSPGFLGKHVTREEIEIEEKRNAKVITTFDMSDYLDEKSEGIYILILRRPERRWHSSIKWVRITDLGIMTKKAQDELTVYINSIENLSPQEGVTVKLISLTNQVLLEGVTDSEGRVSFENLRKVTEGFSPFVITAEKGRDLSFLKLSDCRLSLGDFDVGGAGTSKEGYEAFVYTDRGVYRPGDTVRMVTVIREAAGEIPPDFPLKVQIISPDGNIFNEYRGWVGDAGADEFNIEIPKYALTGVYMAKTLIADTVEIGRERFNVEEFMPQRIKVDISLPKETYNTGEDVRLDVKGTMLFGPPAAGRKVQAKCIINSKAFVPEGFAGYHFGDVEKQFDKIELELGHDYLDDEGMKTFEIHIPDNIKPPSALAGLVEVSVYELGGRSVTEHRQFAIHPYPFYIGLRRIEKGYAEKDRETHIDFVVLKPNGEKSKPVDLEFSYYMVAWNTILGRDKTGYYRYVSEKSLDLISRRKVSYNGDVSSVSFIPHHYGQYRVVIEDQESGVSSSIDFYVSGWGYAPWAMAQPEKLMIDFDKKSYKVGEQAVVQIRSPFAGRLVLSVERENILDQKIIEMEDNTATITLPIRKEFKPNVYVVGNLIRSNQSLEIHAPVRAYGAYPLMVDCSEHKLRLDLKAPSHITPKTTLNVSIGVRGGTGRTYLTVAAVDEGICQITDYVTPEPFEYFYRKRRLSVETYDIYSLILPEIEKLEERSSPGGGRAEELARHLMPVALRRVKPVALWSGIIRTNQDGKANVPLEVPQFQGSLRLMVVAFDGDKYGATSKNVTVSDPIVLTPTFPRFVCGTDSFRIPVNVYNGTEKEGDVSVKLSVDGPVEVLSSKEQSVNVASKAEKLVKFICTAANEIGALHFKLDASGFGSATRYEVDVPLRPASPLVTEIGAGRIEDDGEVAFEIDKSWFKGTTELQINTSPFALINFGHSLRFLLRYPHGCVEQTTSKLFPLLYFSDIAKVIDPPLFKDRSADYFILEGIAKLRSMQMASGAFAYWPGGGSESEWGSIYATHFLVEAQKAGYQVSDRILDKATRHLKKMLKKDLRDETRRYQLERQAYAAYVLALLGKSDKSSMNYLRQVELENMSTWAQSLLAGAFALSGDINTAMSMMTFEIGPSQSLRETGENFNSSTRENAIMLEVLNEIDPGHPSIPILVKAIAERLKERSNYTTQENAYGLMALGKSLRLHEAADFKGKIWWNDELLGTFDNKNKVIKKDGGEGKEIKIKIEGKGPCYYYWYFSGIRKGADIEEYNRGLKVNRVYLNEYGHPIRYDEINQGDIVVAKITMTAIGDHLQNVIITDMLPAGLEIENPRLESRSMIDWIGEKAVVPDYMDIRDDRFNIYLNLPKGQTKEFYYMLRAVTPGTFVLPPIKGEAMYDPFRASVANSGMIRIVPVR